MTARRLPSGVVTFVLTDIVGSTRLWEQAPSATATALGRHDERVAAAIAAHGGVLLKSRGEGDSTFSVFVRATDAVRAAHAAQRALVGEPWPDDAPLIAFYGELFGWKLQPFEGGGYTMIDTNGGGGINGGIGKSQTGEPWSTFHVAAEDLEEVELDVAQVAAVVPHRCGLPGLDTVRCPCYRPVTTPGYSSVTTMQARSRPSFPSRRGKPGGAAPIGADPRCADRANGARRVTPNDHDQARP